MIGYAEQISTLHEGSIADIAVLEIEEGMLEFPKYARGTMICGK